MTSEQDIKLSRQMFDREIDRILTNMENAKDDPVKYAYVRGMSDSEIDNINAEIRKQSNSAQADAQREPELSNAEIARELVGGWLDSEIPGEVSSVSDADAVDLTTRIKTALDTKDTRSRPTAENPRHWMLKAGASATACGQDATDLQTLSLLVEYVTCADCKHVMTGYMAGRADERTRSRPTVAEIRRQAFDEAIAIIEKHDGAYLLTTGLEGDIVHSVCISLQIKIEAAARDAAPTDPEKDLEVEATGG